MPISRDTAARLVADLKSCCDTADRLLHAVTPALSPPQSAELRGLVGQFMGRAYLNIMRPLLNQFPGLPFPVGATGETSAAPAFSSEAAGAIERHRDLIRAGEESGIFRTGTLHEVEAALQDLNVFLSQADRGGNPA